MRKPQIAIPIPTSFDMEYNRTCWPQYAGAVESAGGQPLKVDLALGPAEIAHLARSCSAVLLPGSPADVNPQKYGHPLEAATNRSDPERENVDELLLQDAHNLHKPILGICYGLQSLNVWRGGTLIQDLAVMPVNHSAGTSVSVAHMADVESRSGSGLLVATVAELEQFLRLPVNSSHHQAVGIVGDGLSVVARCPQDGVVEAVEGTAQQHFVLGVQWHPERSTGISEASRLLFRQFVEQAAAWVARPIETSVVG